MGDFAGYFDAETLRALFQILLRAGCSEPRMLLAPLRPDFVETLNDRGESKADRLYAVLHDLNRCMPLVDGSVPLWILVRSASARLTARREPHLIALEEALRPYSDGRATPPSPMAIPESSELAKKEPGPPAPPRKEPGALAPPRRSGLLRYVAAFLAISATGVAVAIWWPSAAPGGASGDDVIPSDAHAEAESPAPPSDANGADAHGMPSPCPAGMVHVPGGSFKMGSEDKDAKGDEVPLRDVHLRPYCIDRTEVTVAAYRRCVSEKRGNLQCEQAPTAVRWTIAKPPEVASRSVFCNGSLGDPGKYPINCVDWIQASTYCKWAGARLPTEAEWEYAARGGDGRRYPWGSADPSATLLNACGPSCRTAVVGRGLHVPQIMYQEDDRFAATAPVGSCEAGASPFGALDMAGNVAEWVADYYGPYDEKMTENPEQTRRTTVDPVRVVRGGSWQDGRPGDVRGSNRDGHSLNHRHEDIGFRCARSLP